MHAAAAALLAAIRRYEQDPALALDASKVTQETWRVVPAFDECGYRITRLWRARPGSRGSLLVTVYSMKEWER